MYSLDINFLKDRPELSKGSGPKLATKKNKQPTKAEDMIPIAAGGAAAVLFPATVGLLLMLVNAQESRVQAEIQDLDAKLGNLQGRAEQVKALEAKMAQATAETNALGSVFYQIKPWSAMLQDIRDRIPPGVQLNSIQQQEVSAQSQDGTTQYPPTMELTLKGIGSSYSDVNDFLLLLQQSNFLNAEESYLKSARLTNNPTAIKFPEVNGEEQKPDLEIELPQVVEYEISTQLNSKPAYELVQELNQKGAVGLVTRIETLKQKGVIKQ